MKFTRYFHAMRSRPDRGSIKLEWILQVVENPMKTEMQADGRVKKWGRIEEVQKVLRVILLEDGETIHNAFFDRGFAEDERHEN